jgi:endonuclease-3 related protein
MSNLNRQPNKHIVKKSLSVNRNYKASPRSPDLSQRAVDHASVGPVSARRGSPNTIQSYYRALLRRWGPQNWWPAQSRFEVIVGAFLTQNTAWGNVEKAIANLRRAGLLSVKAIRDVPLAELEQHIRPSGYFRQKALRLKNFIAYLDSRHGGSLGKMFAQPSEVLRSELLELNGVGSETADSILLYGGGHAVFVVDAYTRRILERHGIIDKNAGYDEIRFLIQYALAVATPKLLEVNEPGTQPRHPVSRVSAREQTPLAQHFNELHALIVRTGNEYCRKTAKCEGCPLNKFLNSPPQF